MQKYANESASQSSFQPFTLSERWEAICEPASEVTARSFLDFSRRANRPRTVLNCAIPLARAKQLTNFQMPEGWDIHKCLMSSQGKLEPGLENWNYQTALQPATQNKLMHRLPLEFAALKNSPWFDSPSQATGIGINARHLRYHHSLWDELKPKTLRGLHTTLVFVSPQIGFSLEPHIKLDKAFCYLAAQARAYMPAQLFPARYLFPDARLGHLADWPAPIFADILPSTGGVSYPLMDCTPDPEGVIARFENNDKYYGYPFSRMETSQKDATLSGIVPGTMLLPNGRRVAARTSESYVYATLDQRLKEDLKRDRDEFAASHCLTRGAVTHDGLPFQLPVELQSMVFAVILTHWEMELDQPGELENYTLKTRHAAIRGFNYYQRVEPYYSNFLRLINKVAKDPAFCTYPLATHLTHPWLGGNLCKSNQLSESERRLGPGFMQAYYLQQLDWLAGIFNLWNHVNFRQGANLEKTLNMAGLAFHQMQPLLRFDSHLFQRPLKRASFWPETHRNWATLNRTGQMPHAW